MKHIKTHQSPVVSALVVGVLLILWSPACAHARVPDEIRLSSTPHGHTLAQRGHEEAPLKQIRWETPKTHPAFPLVPTLPSRVERLTLHVPQAHVQIGTQRTPLTAQGRETYWIGHGALGAPSLLLIQDTTSAQFRGYLLAADRTTLSTIAGRVQGNVWRLETLRPLEYPEGMTSECLTGKEGSNLTTPLHPTKRLGTKNASSFTRRPSQREDLWETQDKTPFLAPQQAFSTTAALVVADVAIDTDVELLTLKFGGNSAAAQSYLSDLFGLMNLIYERDLGVRLRQGHTLLRTGEPDPYTATAVRDQLSEVGHHWRTTPALQNSERAFVLFLSGKSASPNGSSGIAWVLKNGVYCEATGTQQGPDTVGHYSAVQVFRFAGSTAAHDVMVSAHEIGHSMGVEHTHCTQRDTGASPSPSNTIDACFNLESGCYAGPVSCPVDNSIAGRGSLMSYCHFGSPAANCGPILQEFHPTHQGILDARILTNTQAGCLVMATTPSPDRLFCDGFEAQACTL